MPIFLSKPRLGLKAWSSRTQQSNLVSKRSLSQCKELQSRHRVLSLGLWFANLHLPGSPNMLNCSTGLNSLDDLKNNLPLSPLPCTFPSELQPSQQNPRAPRRKALASSKTSLARSSPADQGSSSESHRPRSGHVTRPSFWETVAKAPEF